jgi:predicted MFS family arabinose efflux permease
VGGFWTFAPAAATQLVPPASKARAMSLVLAGVSAATMLGVPAGAAARHPGRLARRRSR